MGLSLCLLGMLRERDLEMHSTDVLDQFYVSPTTSEAPIVAELNYGTFVSSRSSSRRRTGETVAKEIGCPDPKPRLLPA